MPLKISSSGLLLILSLACVHAVSAAPPPSVNVSYRGNLVAEPCTLLPGDESIAVDFGAVVDKYLYMNTRTQSKPFQLHLMDCDTSLGKTVKMTFSGTESVALPGLLSPDGKGEERGIAIGLETHEGDILALNKISRGQDISDGNNVINLKAYVAGEPDAIRDRNIKKGGFSAVATFSLEYE